MLSHYDYIVIAFYFIFMTLMSWVMKRFVRNTSDYFRGGGEMLWWIAGAGAFTVSFSAVTFTGMAGKAYTDGPIVMVIFVGNAIGFVINYLWFAPMSRQTRAVTAMQVVRSRFGRANEQFFTWVQIPLGVCYAGIWLSGLGVFVAAAFGMSESTTIIITGSVVIIMALVGGSWSVMAGDFVQTLVLMPVSIVAAFLSLRAVGGVHGFFEKMPTSFYHWGEAANFNLVAVWVFATLIQKFVSTNSMQDASRYLSVKDSKHARKAALLGAILHTIGPVLWFIPPMAARIAYPHIETMFPGVKNPAEASFFAIAANTMPAGMVGLLLSAIFGATMSAMDGGLNKNAGFFVKNFYQPYVRPNATERHLLLVGKMTTLSLGLIIILSGLVFAASKDTNIFKQMTLFSGLVGLPVTIPLVLGLMIKRAPGWAGWSTVLVTLAASTATHFFLTAERAGHVLGFVLNSKDGYYWDFLAGTLINLFVGCTWFCGTALIGVKQTRNTERSRRSVTTVTQPSNTLEYQAVPTELSEAERIEEFFTRIKTPVDFEKEEGVGSDNMQARIMGLLCLIYAGFILLLMAIPNPWLGRCAFAFCGLMMASIGGLLLRGSHKKLDAEADQRMQREESVA